MKKFLICIIFIVLVVNQVFSEWIKISNKSGDSKYPNVSLIEDNIEIEFYGYNIEKKIENNIEFNKINIPGCGKIVLEGKPELPVLFIHIEVNPEIQHNIRNVTYETKKVNNINKIYPAQKFYLENEIHNFSYEESFYEKDIFYPNEIVKIDNIITVRNHKILIIKVYPISYNPNKKEIIFYTNINFEVNGIKSYAKDSDSMIFSKFLNQYVLNYNNVLNGSKQLSEKYLIITHDLFFNTIPLNEFKEYLEFKGYNVEIIKLSDIPNSQNPLEIRKFIRDNYTGINFPTFLLLVGDSDFIPTFYRGSGKARRATDLYYACLDEENIGVDYHPDLFVGRFPVRNIFQLKNIIEKIIQYNNYKFNPLEYKKHFFFASYYDPKGDRFYVEVCEEIAKFLRNKNYVCREYYTHEIESLVDNTQVINIINEENLITIHRDHGCSRNNDESKYDGWSAPLFTTGDLGRVNNKIFPVMFSINCQTGWFDGETDRFPDRNYSCLGEELLRAKGKGVSCFIGATRSTDTFINHIFLKGLIDGLFPDFRP